MFQVSLLPLLLTLKVAACATLLALIGGVPCAVWLSRMRWFAGDVADAILTLPLVLPPTVVGYYLLVVLGRNGAVGAWLEQAFGIRLIFTWQGAAIAAAIVSFPLLLKPARIALDGVDRQLEQAARTLGCSEIDILFRITLPLAWRGILGGAMLAFARAAGEFGATLMIAGNLPGNQTLSAAIYDAVQAGQDDLAATLVLIVALTCLVILVVAGRLQPKWQSTSLNR